MNLLPGIYWKEIDLSNYTPRLSTTTVAIVGTASKGPINQRSLIGNVDQLAQVHGYPSDSHPGLRAAREYLREGNQLWFTRVESEANPAAVAEIAVASVGGGAAVDWLARDPGTFYNGVILKFTHSNPINVSLPFTGNAVLTVFAGTLQGPLVPGSVRVRVGGASVATDNSAGVVAGTGITGTVNYDTGAVSVTFTAAPADGAAILIQSGAYSTFGLDVQKVIENKSYTMESFRNLSLNNLLENYYQRLLASSVMVAAPAGLTAMPAAGSYVLTGGDDGLTGIDDADYIGQSLGTVTTGLQLYANAEEVDVNTVSVPGRTTSAVREALVTLAETRRDCMVLIDPPQGLSVEEVIDWINGSGTYASLNALNSSYAAVYYPWVKTYDSYNDAEVLSPPSGFAMAAFTRSDRFGPHYAPAGASRGKVLGATGLERSLNAGQKTALYLNRINPISDFIASGILIWGQKTTQVIASDLDRIIGRRTLLEIEKVVVTALQPLVFEPNNKYTWARATALIQPYLDGHVARGSLYYGKVVCDDKTNTGEVIARNEMVVNVFLKLPKSAEIITVNFIMLATGAEVEEYIGRQF